MPKPATLPTLPAEAAEFQDLLQQLVAENAATDNWHSNVSALPAYERVRALDAAGRGRLALAALAVLRHHPGRRATTMVKLLEALMRSTVDLRGAGFVALFQGYGLRFPAPGAELIREALHVYPVAYTLGQVEKEVKKNGLDEPLAAYLREFLVATQHELTGYLGADVAKLQRRLQGILGAGQPDGLPVLAFAKDALGRFLAQTVAALAPPAADPATAPRLRLLYQWQQASGGQPGGKYQQAVATELAALGPDDAREWGRMLLTALLTIRPEDVVSTNTYRDQTYTRTDTVYLLGPSQNLAKGLIWALGPLADAPMQAQLASYAGFCFQPVPGRGPLALALTNACLWALAAGGQPGITTLARVRGRFKQANTQALIAGYIERAAQALGVSPAEIEDLAVPDFNLQHGRVVEAFGDYTATLRLHDGRAEVSWTKEGKPLKAAPAALKATHAAELKELKATQTQAQQTYTAQRDRLDRSFVEERRIPWPWFEPRYFQHGLLGLLVRPLIWRLHHPNGTHHDALFLHEEWRDAQGQPVPAPAADTTLQLWHPVLVEAAEVLAWRQLLDQHQLRQPVKQAYREVYLLTPPEERTRTYSNRMAAHLLRQHQFSSLARLRGWHYKLMGAYDKGYESDKATMALPAHRLTAEFWVSEVNADDAFNDTGIWHYVSTDQVRFVGPDGAAVPLPDVPPLPFSEVMRDVDLFVGVASVGNDPLWRDNGGLVQYRDYWTHYSFGELGEVAKTRRLALERLLPRLKVGKVSTLTERFLEVQGRYHLYRIHLGSGNILMAPGDRYLCIVPDRSAKAAPGSSDVFLPFEGDAVLSIILSKALLLMDDDQITDATIVRQIRPR